MLANNLNTWFNSNQCANNHYTSQPNFNLSDYQQIDQLSKSSAGKQQIKPASTTSESIKYNATKKSSNSSISNKNIRQKKLIQKAFQPSLVITNPNAAPMSMSMSMSTGKGDKSKSNMNLNRMNSNKPNSGDKYAELISNTYSNFGQNDLTNVNNFSNVSRNSNSNNSNGSQHRLGKLKI